MYEDKKSTITNIDWKSLIIKMAILVVVVFIIMWISSLIKGKNKTTTVSNIQTNLKEMKSAANHYFVGSKLPERVNSKKRITLQDMVDQKLIIDFKDQDNKSCNMQDSYAEATKINDEDYTIRVVLVCDKDSDYVINTVTYENPNKDENVDKPIIDDNKNNDDKEEDKNQNSSSNTNKPNNSVSVNKPSTSTKPNTSTTQKPNTTQKPSTSQKPSTNTCKYGSLNSTFNYPLIYKVSGCPVTKDVLYQYQHTSTTNTRALKEYSKLVSEIDALERKTGASLYVEQPIFEAVMNKEGTGFVGFQAIYSVKQKLSYTTRTVYYYYLDENGNRKVIIDNRNSISSNNNNNNNNKPSQIIHANSIYLNRSNVDLKVNGTYYLSATVSPSNTTDTISWSSSNSNIVSVSNSGKLTGKKAGSATIYATINGHTDTVYVTVTNNQEVNIYNSYLTMYVGDTDYIDVNLSGLSWWSSNSNIVSVNNYGKVIASQAGTVRIYASNGDSTDSIEITVLNRNSNNNNNNYYPNTTIPYVIMKNKSQNVKVGEKVQIGYTSNSGLKWISSDTSIATIDKYGQVTGKKAGSITVRAEVSNNSRIFDTITINVIDTYVRSTYNSVSLFVDDSMLIPYETNMPDKPTFTSSNSNIVKIDGNKMIAKKAGSATITIKVNGKTAKLPVTVLKDNDSSAYTKTYYMVTYVDKYSKGDTITQNIRFNEISAYNNIKKVNVSVFDSKDSYSFDYLNYMNNYLGNFTVYSGTNQFNARYSLKDYKELKKYSLKDSNVSVTSKQLTNNGAFALQINTKINNFSGATSYNGGYLVPIKVNISYE